MLIRNPGSAHFDVADGSALLTFADYSGPAIAVGSISNDPAAELSD